MRIANLLPGVRDFRIPNNRGYFGSLLQTTNAQDFTALSDAFTAQVIAEEGLDGDERIGLLYVNACIVSTIEFFLEHEEELLAYFSTDGGALIKMDCKEATVFGAVSVGIGVGLTTAVKGMKAGALAAAVNPPVGAILGALGGFTIGFIGGAITGGIGSALACAAVNAL